MATRFQFSTGKFAALAALTVVLLAAGQRTVNAGPAPSNVNVVNTPGVNVVSLPAVHLATAVPFQAQVLAEFEPGTNGASAGIEIPAGKRLEVENVSALAALDNDVVLRYVAVVTLDQGGGSEAEHYLVMSPQGSIPGIADYFSANHPMRAHAIGALAVRAFRSTEAGYGHVSLTVTGHLVDAN
ncbi:MAG TPA: hypothetical protein VM686_42210 [Polyangiaceae bacterium]|nr:hypothetical protein [Polyangiaceae bacterium]